MSGEGSMIATSCKIFYLNKFSSSFQEMLYNLFNMEVPEMSDREESEYSCPSQLHQMWKISFSKQSC